MAKYSKEKMTEYMQKRRSNRRTKALVLLGGKCSCCQSKNNLEFDHIHRDNKFKTIASLYDATEKIFWSEIAKCQLLCNQCHKQKTAKEMTKPLVHGLNGYYKGCKCRMCLDSNRDYHRARRNKLIAPL